MTKIKWNSGLFLMFIALCSAMAVTGQKKGYAPIQDKPFVQEYSIKFNYDNERNELTQVASDRNGYIQVISLHGLLRPRAGEMLFPGTLVKDVHFKATSDKGIRAVVNYRDQFVYVDDKAILSNAWAGTLYTRHNIPEARVLAAGKDFVFLISDGKKLQLLNKEGSLWEGESADPVKEIAYDTANDQFWIRGENSIQVFQPVSKKLETVIKQPSLTAIDVWKNQLVVGTSDGYFTVDTKNRQVGETKKDLPWTEITSVKNIGGDLWFGSTWGAFKLNSQEKYDYYASKRWLPSDKVIDIAKGPENSVLILTDKGLGQICREEMTLYDKAMFYEKQVRARHIRFGFNATISGMTDGDVTTGSMETSDNDGLWTTMYLAGEVFRYAVTKSGEALQNIRESMDAMERLYAINPVPGFPSRSFERRGYKYHDKPWRRAEDPEWDWKSTTSSDEAIGHIFAFGAIAELVDVPKLKDQAIMLIDTLMSHALKNDHYLVDWNGEPTLWGKWNPEYVNARPKGVGDRKINSSNYIGMLQTAYHFTGKEKYKTAAYELMDKHGYLENLMRPMNQIGKAPEDADDWSKMLSEAWNHSDDEMYYCGYWGLYRYAFTKELKAKYKEAIVDHWEAERPEKDALWNIMTALVGKEDYDFDNAAWYLREYPLDLINWTVNNSHRKDIQLIPENFREQTIAEVLPPDELRISRHNANRFDLDGGSDGRSENSAGDIWLLPYWIGRYLGVISEPAAK
ncbi:hypothetical protein [Maribellus sp. YY47]|uniref:hypothetical protein n=1 Tax=Maribellus sp. YY47 TaxID=2929486 RepID=UPI002000B346|nr:hypothetical protein [Maribellus sp. YY47]MCK3682822.1 hypothetical protein [Maribellus sp. YY47]